MRNPALRKEFGDWKVMDNGEVRNDHHKIRIQPDRFSETDWWQKLLRHPKSEQFDWYHFMLAWEESAVILGKSEFVVKI